MTDRLTLGQLRDLAAIFDNYVSGFAGTFGEYLSGIAARREAEQPKGPLPGIEAGLDAVHPKSPRDGLVPNPPYIGPGSAAAPFKPCDICCEPQDCVDLGCYAKQDKPTWPGQPMFETGVQTMTLLSDVPIGSVWAHTNGIQYRVVLHTNVEGTKPKYPITVCYQNIANGKVYSRPLHDWARSMTRIEDKPAPAADDLPSELRRAAFDLGQEGDVAGSRLIGNAADRIEALQARVAELERDQNIFQNAAGKAAVRAEGLEDLYEKSQALVARLTEALGLVLPLAKGYVANHDYASSREYIAVAESILAEANDAP
jgi:hypothetical protein